MNTSFKLQFDIQLFEDITIGSIYEGTENNDSITSSGTNIKIDAKGGNDRIYHTSGSGATIDGGSGRETIIAYAENASINGGADNDLINLNLGAYKNSLASISNSNGATIIGGAGNDTIRADVNGTGRVFVFGDDDGADYIYGIKSGDTISLADGASLSSSVYSGEDFLLTIGNTKVLLKKPTNGFKDVELTVGSTKYTIPALHQGTKNSDEYSNTENNIVVDLLGGNDSVSNSGSDVTIYGGAGNDTITNSTGNNVLLDGGAGNDKISVQGGSSIKVEGGAGADTIEIAAGASGVTIEGGAANDYIKAINTGNVYIYTEGDGKDTIEGYNSSDTIIVTAGIIGEGGFVGSDFVINIGKGSLTFKNIDADVTDTIQLIQPDSNTKTVAVPRIVQGTKGAERLESSHDSYKIDAGAGNDTISVSGGSNTVLAGAGNDVINLGAGSGGANVSVGAGNDVISIEEGSGEHTFVFGTADGNNTIYGLTASDTLSFGTSSLSTAISADGNNFLLTSGKTTVAVADYFDIAGTSFNTMKTGNAASASVEVPKILQGTKNNDSALTLAASLSGFVIEALAGNDTIDNAGSTVTIHADAGNDVVTNTGSTVEIYGAAGNDSITNSGSSVKIEGGDGADTISNSGSSVTIDGGAGVDDITNTGSSVSIFSGDGNDKISNTGASVTIDGGAGVDDITNTGSSVSIFGGEGNDKISLGNDAASVTINGGKGNDAITITAEAEDAESVPAHVFVYENGDGNDDIYGYGAGDSITIIDSSDYTTSISGLDFVINVGTGRTAGKITLHEVVGALDKTTINGAEVAIAKVLQGTTGNDSLSISSDTYRVEGLAGNDTISIASGTSSISVNGGLGDDYIIAENGGGNFYIYASGDGNDTIQGFSTSDTIHITSGALDSSVVSGKNLTLNVGKGSMVLENVIGNVDKISIKAGDGALKEYEINLVKVGTAKADNMFNEDGNYLISVGGGNDTVENYGANVKVEAGVGNDYVFNGGNSVVILGEAGNDTVESFGDSVTVDGGAGADYIYSDGKDNSVSGGAGNDTIEIAGESTTVVYSYGDGNDTVYGFTDGDTLQIKSAQISSATANGTDVILKVGSGSVRLMDMAGRTINYAYDGDDTANTTVVSGAITGTARADKIENEYAGFTINALAGNDTVKNEGDKATIDGGTGADSITNTGSGTSIFGGTGNDIISSTGENVTIDGGQGHDKITIGSGSDSVTVTGGAGNDTITATGAGKVLFNYASGDGRDVIVGFSAGDTVKFSGVSISQNSISGGTDAVVKFSGGSVTFKGVGSDKLNVSGNTITYSAAASGGNDFWFAEDDTNFIGGASISEIVAQDYSVTNIEAADSTDELAQGSTILAAADK